MVQRVESNRKEIVLASTKIKTLRKMKAEKRKRQKEAFYFISTEASVDPHAHWDQLGCGVITDEVETNGTSMKTVKVLKS